MTCRDFEADVVDLARGAEIGADAEARLDRHLDQCANCSARLARERELTAALKAMAGAEPLSTKAQAIEAELLAAFDRQRAAAATQRASLRPGPARRHVRAWFAAAAVLVLAVAAWQVAVRGPSPRGAVAGIDTERARPGASPGSELSPQADGQETAFVALPSAIGLPALESGRIVRVALPAAELPAYGFIVEPRPVGGAIEADVLVGQDGQPRAIRFVTVETDSRRPQ
jgi:hypothetical protein